MMSLLNLLRFLPLPLLRWLGAVLGHLLYALLAGRRHVVKTNLRLCFPAWSASKREALARKVFVRFVQSFLDRTWLWHASDATLHQRLRLMGDTSVLQGEAPTVLFAPHFMGMDAGWLAMNFLTPDNRGYAGIYAPQTNVTMAQWIKQGRARHNLGRPAPAQISNKDGVRGVLKALQGGTPLYVLPDMNYEPDDSLFLPFFGVTAATLPILPRYAKLGGRKGFPAKVVPIITRMTDAGYDVMVHPPWDNYPSGTDADSLTRDTLRMNRALEEWILTMPEQYYWVHKRFKDQPHRAAGPY